MLSLYIPIITDSFINEKYIANVFRNKNFGDVSRVDFVKNVDKNGRREAFIHFEKWYDNDESRAFQKDVCDNSTKTRLFYSEKKFWPVLVNTNPNREGENPAYEIIDKEDINKFIMTKFCEKMIEKGGKRSKIVIDDDGFPTIIIEN